MTTRELIHVGLIQSPGGGYCIIGAPHVQEYREEVVSYEIVSIYSGAACDVCGELLITCWESRRGELEDNE